MFWGNKCFSLIHSFVALPSTPLLSDACESSPSDAYELATHTVKVRRTGALYDVMALWDLSGSFIIIYSYSKYIKKEKKKVICILKTQ